MEAELERELLLGLLEVGQLQEEVQAEVLLREVQQTGERQLVALLELEIAARQRGQEIQDHPAVPRLDHHPEAQAVLKLDHLQDHLADRRQDLLQEVQVAQRLGLHLDLHLEVQQDLHHEVLADHLLRDHLLQEVLLRVLPHGVHQEAVAEDNS